MLCNMRFFIWDCLWDWEVLKLIQGELVMNCGSVCIEVGIV